MGYRLSGDTARAVLWREGVVTELVPVPGVTSYAAAINDRDEIVGRLFSPQTTRVRRSWGHGCSSPTRTSARW